MLLGSLVGLASALAWAMTTVLVRPLLGHCGLGATNAVRFVVGAALFIFVSALTGNLGLAVSLNTHAYLLLLLSATVSLVIGDSAYFVASRRIGVARALPISMSYPVLTALVAVFFLGESASWALWTGAVLVVGGAILLGLPARQKGSLRLPATAGRWDVPSIALAVLAAVGWAGSVLVVKLVLAEADPVTINVVRTFFAALLSTGLALSSPRLAGTWPRGRWAVCAVAVGALAMLSSLTFVAALEMVGAARASILNAAAPLFAAPIARFALAEPVSPRTLVGIAGTVAGIMLIV